MPRRPDNYKAVDLRQIQMLAHSGWDNAKLAEFYGVKKSTFNNWIVRNYNGIGDAVQTGIDDAIARVERSMYEVAIGYKHPDVKIMSVPKGNNQGSRIVKTKYTKHYPPNVPAGIFYLINKRKELWKHRFELQTDDGVNRLPDMSDMSFRELKELTTPGIGNLDNKKLKKSHKLKKDVLKVEEDSRLDKLSGKKSKKKSNKSKGKKKKNRKSLKC